MPCRRLAATTPARAAGPTRASHGHGVVHRYHRESPGRQAQGLPAAAMPSPTRSLAVSPLPDHHRACQRQRADAGHTRECRSLETSLAASLWHLAGSLVGTVALRYPTVVGRVPARQVPAVHMPWPLVTPRFDRLSKLPSLHRDHRRRRPWLPGISRRGLLLLAHVRSLSFAIAATRDCAVRRGAPADERSSAGLLSRFGSAKN